MLNPITLGGRIKVAVLKCRMCGGDIVAGDGQTYGACDSCGSVVTLPRVDDQRMENLFNRANHFRLISEFDRAIATYEIILNEDNTNAEAHWGLLLSRYGIEYVEDPVSRERIPTCHRIHTTSILSDDDYMAALHYAPDEYSYSLYEAEGKRLTELQRSMLQVSAQAEPFDVFICYKETTDGGSRTKDSALAQDIYYQLVNAGFHVFFARVTLENILGRQYEPYIFAALNSAKVMLVIGTKPEHFNAVWVKNEWSRFLDLSRKDHEKVLIPCYRDMNVYNLPDKLSVLQSQDMSKIGFMQDLLHGIEKVIRQKKATETQREGNSGIVGATPGVDPLYRRACLFLEDGDFVQANEYFDRVLDLSPEFAPAYMGKLCVDKQINMEARLSDLREPIDEEPNFKKAVRFADVKQKEVYLGYQNKIKELILLDKNEAAYCCAIAAMEKSKNINDYRRVASRFNELGDFKDAKVQADACIRIANNLALQEKEEMYRAAVEKKQQAYGEHEFIFLARTFERMGDFRDAKQLAQECRQLVKEYAAKQKEELYQEAIKKRKEAKKEIEYLSAGRCFKALGDYKDALYRAEMCQRRAQKAAIRERREKLIRRIITILVLIVGAALCMLYYYVILPANTSNSRKKSVSAVSYGVACWR